MKRFLRSILLLTAVITMVYAGAFTEVKAEGRNYYNVGDTGHMDLVEPEYCWYFDGVDGTIVSKKYIVEDPSVITVDEAGNYQVLAAGESRVTVNGYNIEGTEVFIGYYTFYAIGDVSAVTFDKSTVDIYMFMNGNSWWSYYDAEPVYVKLLNAPDLTYHTFEYAAENADMGVYCNLNEEEKTLEISASREGTTALTVTLNGKMFTIRLTARKVSINQTSSIIAKKKTTTLRVDGYPGKVVWKTTNKKNVTVNKKGQVKGKKVGNAVVYTEIGNHKIGCAVSVVTPKMKKVIQRAKNIVKTSKYSQANRMSDKYYDCSSLVWKSYKTMGKYFGNPNYAPVAADIGRWCAGHKKTIKGGCSEKNVSSMKLRPGDLLFKTGEKNGRYKGIYHVEMFVGYQCDGFNGDKPVLGTLWAARSENYGGSGYMMARP